MLVNDGYRRQSESMLVTDGTFFIGFGEGEHEGIGLHQTFLDEQGPRGGQGEPNKAKTLRNKPN